MLRYEVRIRRADDTSHSITVEGPWEHAYAAATAAVGEGDTLLWLREM